MMFALGITRDFRAHDASGVIVILRAANTADGALIQEFDIKRAG